MGRVHQFRGPRRRRPYSGRDIKYIAQLLVFSALTGLAVFKGPENLPFLRDIPQLQSSSSPDWTDFAIVDDRSETTADTGSCDITVDDIAWSGHAPAVGGFSWVEVKP
jgi:hypothetical protein